MQTQTIFIDPVPLPSPSVLERWLFESPGVPAVVIGVLGVVAAVVLWRAGRGKVAGLVVLVSVAMAGGVVLTARLVQTEREGMIVRAVGLVDAVARGDAEGVGALLAGPVALEVLGTRSGRTRVDILREVGGDVAGRYGARSPRVVEASAVIDGPYAARTRLVVRFEGLGGNAGALGGGGAVSTTWLLHWQRDTGGVWQVWTIKAERIGLLPQGSVRW